MKTLAFVYVPPGTVDAVVATMHQWGIQNNILATGIGFFLLTLVVFESVALAVGFIALLFEIMEGLDWELLIRILSYIVITLLIVLCLGLVFGTFAAIIAAIGSII